jgi:hypothetical protein
MTTLISSTSLLAQRSGLECYPSRWGRCIPLEEAREERRECPGRGYRLIESVSRTRESYPPAICPIPRCREGCLVLSASVTRLCSYVGRDVSCWFLSPLLLDSCTLWPLGRSRQRTSSQLLLGWVLGKFSLGDSLMRTCSLPGLTPGFEYKRMSVLLEEFFSFPGYCPVNWPDRCTGVDKVTKNIFTPCPTREDKRDEKVFHFSSLTFRSSLSHRINKVTHILGLEAHS